MAMRKFRAVFNEPYVQCLMIAWGTTCQRNMSMRRTAVEGCGNFDRTRFFNALSRIIGDLWERLFLCSGRGIMTMMMMMHGTRPLVIPFHFSVTAVAAVIQSSSRATMQQANSPQHQENAFAM